MIGRLSHSEFKTSPAILIRFERTLSIACICVLFGITSHGQEELSSGTRDLELVEAKVALESAIVDNAQLQGRLREADETLAALQRNLTAANSEGEVFRRQAGELRLRLEAVGIESAGGNVGQRLLKAVGDMKLLEDERKQLSDALIRLSEAVIRYQKVTVTNDPEARLALEAEMRGASKALGVAPHQSLAGTPVSSTLTEGMVISIKEDLALIVANLGSRHGVKVGMPFQVHRGDSVVGTVRMVDVRDKIAGAVVQNLISEGQKVKVGDRLKVDARK